MMARNNSIRINRRRRQRTNQTIGSHVVFVLVLATILLLANILPITVAQEPQQEAEQTNALDYLESLTTEELELICVERGFELVHDENEPGALTHADYVEAAQRCLAIEEDMYVLLRVCVFVEFFLFENPMQITDLLHFSFSFSIYFYS